MRSPDELHRTLRRQMSRTGLDASAIEDERLLNLLDRVSSAYEDADKQRYLHDRAFLLASTEMQNLYDRLEQASQSAAAVQRDRLRAVFDSAATGLIVLEPDGQVFDLNPVAESLLGMSRDEVRERNFDDVIMDADDANQSLLDLRTAVAEGRNWRSSDSQVISGSGHGFSAALLYRPMETGGGVLAIEDITERKQAQAELMWRANHDALTGLFNRAAVIEHINRALSRARRYGTLVAVMFIDLDRFKRVNDTLGHAAGDELLVECASRISAVMREVDTVGRLGGDEFVAVCENLTSTEDARIVAARLTEAVEQPFTIGGDAAFVECSVGIAMSDGYGADADDLLRDSDIALYESKQSSGSTVTLYTEAMIHRIRQSLELERKMRKAMPADEFWVAYQPIFTIPEREVVGFEALARWDSPSGPVGPDEFIPAADAAGLLNELGRRLLEEALEFHGTLPAGTRMFVNMAPAQIAADGIIEWLDDVVARTGVDPNFVYIELTEMSAMQNLGIEQRLQELRDRGFRVALDDFGVGHSSLASLQNLPVDLIKVDRSFLADTPMDDRARAIARMVCALGETLGIEVIAEGIEAEEQFEFLAEIGCDFGQGFMLGTPQSADKAMGYLP